MKLSKMDLSSLLAISHSEGYLQLLLDRGNEFELMQISAPVEAYEGLKQLNEVIFDTEFSEEEIEAVFGQQQPTAILFRSKADKDAKFVSVFEEAAKSHKGKTLFSLSGVTDGI